MKYVANMFSLKMTDDCVMSKREIDEETFNILLKELRPKSHMNNKEVAQIYGVEYNPTEFHLGTGDCLLLAQKSKNAMDYYCVKVLEEL